MRKDILERMRILNQDDIEVNYTELARQYGCDYRTVKRYFKCNLDEIGKREPKPSILDPYKTIVEDKLQIWCSASAIYRFIKKRG